jgi:flagellin-like protein
MRRTGTVRRRLRSRAGVNNVIAAIILIAITVVAGTALWSVRFELPTQNYYVSYYATAGLKIPTWGDHTDCTPYGYAQSNVRYWQWTAAEKAAWTNFCQNHEVGNFSLMNASAITIDSVSPATMSLSRIDFTFICINRTPVFNESYLVHGSLGSMTWYPGQTGGPAPNAPHLRWCASFDASGHGAFATLYNRLGIFTPISANSQVLQAGDTIILYVHTPRSVFDVDQANGQDIDDYHGAPPWCFTVPNACEIQLTYNGTSQQILATIPIYSISGQAQ